jgi:hypothetical protein
MNGPVGAVTAKGSHPMLFVIKHRYPVLGLGLAEHSTLLIVMSAPFLALSIVQFTYRRRHHTHQVRP